MAVTPGSAAANAGVAAGSTLVSLNGRFVRDALELRFLETAGRVELVWRQADGASGRSSSGSLNDLPLGLDVDPLKMQACNNKCAFCFAIRMPGGCAGRSISRTTTSGSRSSRHFATLTNLTEADIARIVEQRLSPLYISVHATEWALRK